MQQKLLYNEYLYQLDIIIFRISDPAFPSLPLNIVQEYKFSLLFIYLFIYSSAKLTKCTMNIYQYHIGHQVNGLESHSSNQ